MADPVVHLTNGLPDAGTGNITTLGQTLLDGANATHGITTGAAVSTDAAGTLQQYLRGLVKALGSLTSTGNALDVNIKSGANGNGQALMAASAPVVIASNQSAVPVTLASTTLTGTSTVAPAAATTGGATGAKAFSAASTNATSLKGSAGTLYGLVAINTTTTVYYLKLYDKATAPTVGTDVPIQTYPIAASATGAGEVIPFPVGLAFTLGIAWALTAAAADADTGVAATGVTINFQYK